MGGQFGPIHFPPGQPADARPCAAWSPGAATPAASARVAAAAALQRLLDHPLPRGCRSDTAVYCVILTRHSLCNCAFSGLSQAGRY